jgi:hypothetical protein
MVICPLYPRCAEYSMHERALEPFRIGRWIKQAFLGVMFHATAWRNDRKGPIYERHDSNA